MSYSFDSALCTSSLSSSYNNISIEEEKKEEINARILPETRSFDDATDSISCSSTSPLHSQYTALSDILSTANSTPNEQQEGNSSEPSQTTSTGPLSYYYRVAFRGVVALLAGPEPNAQKSKRYLSYGEVFCSTQKELDNKCIRVDQVLTGGYALDEDDSAAASEAETPKRSNSAHEHYARDNSNKNNPLGPSALTTTTTSNVGYIFNEDGTIVEPITTIPKSEPGRFLYQITSSTPLPILTGPCLDAPKTKAMALPGTTHEVSLRVSLDKEDKEAIHFLRLLHRRGWIADRKVSRLGGGNGNSDVSLLVVKELFPEKNDCASSCGSSSSLALSSVAISVSVASARIRHRPPRRHRETNNEIMPRHVGILGRPTPTTTPVKIKGDVHGGEKMGTPCSNLSILSDDESMEQSRTASRCVPTSPDTSYATSSIANRSTATSSIVNRSSAPQSSNSACFFLIRVTAPRGLKVLDAPQFQVNTLIHGNNNNGGVSSSHMVSQFEQHSVAPRSHESIFQTMSGRLTKSSKPGNPAIFESNCKTRVLPRGATVEASRRMESTDAYNQGAGLIKLSDNSGWAIVPRQDELDAQYRAFSGGETREGEATRAFKEVGNAMLDEGQEPLSRVWVRILARNGLTVACPPLSALVDDSHISPASSRGSTAAISSSLNSSAVGPVASTDSDAASSVGSSFLDAMFRTPKKKPLSKERPHPRQSIIMPEPDEANGTIPCGMIVEVERWQSASEGVEPVEFARLCGGQGWLPMQAAGKIVAVKVPRPEFRYGSFWFRVQSTRGIKVRLGPSKRAPSIKSDENVHFRFECGEFLRASEIMTVSSEHGKSVECYAKLYRNKHVRLHERNDEFCLLPSLTARAEWVQVHSDEELYLEECAIDPRIERHKQGWRYNVVPDAGIPIRKGPSFAAAKSGTLLFGGESVVINERVIPAGETMTWLRLKDGQGWVHDVTETGDQIMIPHSLRHRVNMAARPQKAPAQKEEVAYNTIIARLFHSDATGEEGHRSRTDFNRLSR
jgi:hypothetical protein